MYSSTFWNGNRLSSVGYPVCYGACKVGLFCKIKFIGLAAVTFPCHSDMQESVNYLDKHLNFKTIWGSPGNCNLI